MLALLGTLLFQACLVATQQAPGTGGTCPYAKYVGQGETATGCLKPNASCDILAQGVSQDDQKLIVKMHNDIRSNVANGQQTGANGVLLPKASNMRLLTWNSELAYLAQILASQCTLKTDCYRCRMTEEYPTGENIYYQSQDSMPRSSNNWTGAINYWKQFSNQLSSIFANNYQYSAFTQMAWGQTKDIGCGLTRFKSGANRYTDSYVCLYGPSGNYYYQNLYQPGEPCTGCFYKNACCGNTCQNDNGYPNLCELR